MLVLDGGLGHLLKDKGLRIPELPYDQQFLAGLLVGTLIRQQLVVLTNEPTTTVCIKRNYKQCTAEAATCCPAAPASRPMKQHQMLSRLHMQSTLRQAASASPPTTL
jgi:hypothetical protein